MRLAYRVWRQMFRTVLRCLFRLRAEGVANIPRTGPVILVPNHASFLDPPMAGVYCPREVRFVARSTLANSRLLEIWMRQVGVILIDREAPARTSLGRSIEALARGEILAVFPEGTRSRDGRLHEFKKGILKLLDKSGAMAVPTAIIGSFEAWPRHRKLPRPRRCRVRYGPPLTAAEVCAPGGLERLRQAVAALSGQELAPIVEPAAAATDRSDAPSRSFGQDPPAQDAASVG